MKAVRALLGELVGLFLDDGFLALAILVVVGLAAAMAFSMASAPGLAEVLLLGGCLVVLVAGVLRTVWAARRP